MRSVGGSFLTFFWLQDSINIFLGNFVPANEKTDIWDMETDYHLHMKAEDESMCSARLGVWCMN